MPRGAFFPPGANIFHAFDMCDPDDIKVVVIGQDPYHGEGQAHGLCFSVNEHGVPFPPSLVNIFQEVRDDTGAAVPGERQPRPLGVAGRAAAECGADRARTRARLACRQGLGTVHRCGGACDRRAPRPASSTCCGALTRSARARSSIRRATVSCKGGASVAAVGVPGVFRLPPLLAGERLPRGQRPHAGRVVKPPGAPVPQGKRGLPAA